MTDVRDQCTVGWTYEDFINRSSQRLAVLSSPSLLWTRLFDAYRVRAKPVNQRFDSFIAVLINGGLRRHAAPGLK